MNKVIRVVSKRMYLCPSCDFEYEYKEDALGCGCTRRGKVLLGVGIGIFISSIPAFFSAQWYDYIAFSSLILVISAYNNEEASNE